jgi:hypothetical protein
MRSSRPLGSWSGRTGSEVVMALLSVMSDWSGKLMYMVEAALIILIDAPDKQHAEVEFALQALR